MTKNEVLRKLFEENGLEKEDVFIMERGKKKIPIITRTGIEKIQVKHEMEIHYDLQYISEDSKHCVIKATGKIDEGDKIRMIETYGEASPDNNKNAHAVAMCEKRALSRCVLKLAGFYLHGVFGEDENLEDHA